MAFWCREDALWLCEMEGWADGRGTAFLSLNAAVSSGSTQTRHVPEESPGGFHLQSVSKLLLVISFV